MPEFAKVQGLHNHFVIVDARTTPCGPTPEEIIWVCDPKVGACAAAQAARLSGRTEQSEVRVHMPAGTVTIHIRSDEVAEMTGPVAHCITGQYQFPG